MPEEMFFFEDTTIREWRCEGKGTDGDGNWNQHVGRLLHIRADGLEVGTASFQNTEITMSGSVKADEGSVMGSVLTLEAGRAARLELGAISFARSRVACKAAQRPGQVDTSRASFSECELHNLPLSYEVYVGMKSSRRLQNCTGVVLVFGVPGDDVTFVISKIENGREVKSRHWYVMDGKLLVADWFFVMQKMETVGEISAMMRELSSERRAILEKAFAMGPE